MPENPQYNLPPLVDPTTFTQDQMPVIIFANDQQSGLGSFIKWYDRGNQNHTEAMKQPNFVETQGPMLKEIPLSSLFNNAEIYEFWGIKNPLINRKSIIDLMSFDLKSPWWRRMYNFVGLFSQAFPHFMHWLNWPGTYYCSERVARWLRSDPILKSWIEETPSPALLRKLFVDHPNDVEFLGYWLPVPN